MVRGFVPFGNPSANPAQFPPQSVLKKRLGGVSVSAVTATGAASAATTTSVVGEDMKAKKRSIEYMDFIFLQVIGRQAIALKMIVKGCKEHVKPILR
jgi:hypothetical protein